MVNEKGESPNIIALEFQFWRLNLTEPNHSKINLLLATIGVGVMANELAWSPITIAQSLYQNKVSIVKKISVIRVPTCRIRVNEPIWSAIEQ